MADTLDSLVIALTKAAADAPEECAKVIAKGAMNIRNDWREAWSGFSHAPSLPSAVTYDVYTTPRATVAEIGPDKARRQGDLGNLFEYGSVNNSPRPGGGPALAREAPQTEAYLALIAGRLL